MEIGKDLNAHCERVAILSVEIAKEYGLSINNTVKVYTAAKLHDTGKAFLDTKILCKKGSLTAAEKEHIKMHTLYSCKYAFQNGHKDEAIQKAILHHHEDYNGKGYPVGLKGKEIPIEARIIRIADFFDALTHDRVYREKYSLEEAINILKKNKHQLDPELFSLFFLKHFAANVQH